MSGLSQISIIIPALNEESTLELTLQSLAGATHCECILVDGGSNDGTVSIARFFGCTIVPSPRGRGIQMNAGAKAASGELLLFLHADTILPSDFPDLIRDALSREDTAAGAFSLGLDSPEISLQFIARMANLRSRLLQMPYGDQAIFTRASTFFRLGGFPEIEIMEDFVFVRSLARQGRIITLKEKAVSSARRWEHLGAVRTTLINQLVVIGYILGVSPKTLSNLYRKRRNT